MAPELECTGLIGAAEAELSRRFGAVTARRRDGADVWLVYRRPAGTLRVRASGQPPRVASWSVTFPVPHATLSSATAAVGLWPEAAPDVEASSCDAPLIRRRVVADSGSARSLTAIVRGGGIHSIAVFDEPPEWE